MKFVLGLAFGLAVGVGCWWLASHPWVWSWPSAIIGAVFGAPIAVVVTIVVVNLIISDGIARAFGW